MGFPPIEIVVDDPHRCICIMSGNPFPAVTLSVLFCASSFLCFLEYDAAGGYFLSEFEALLHQKSTDEYQLSDRQLVRIGILCLYTINICIILGNNISILHRRNKCQNSSSLINRTGIKPEYFARRSLRSEYRAIAAHCNIPVNRHLSHTDQLRNYDLLCRMLQTVHVPYPF